MALTGYLRVIWLLLVCTLALPATSGPAIAADAENKPVETQMHDLHPEILNTIFEGSERMRFTVSWSGGPKIGDLYIAVEKQGDGYVVRVRVTDYGLFKLIYPVDDTFTTSIAGERKLPTRYEVLQQEGHGSKRETRRLTVYNQEALQVVYRKNEQPEEMFQVDGTVYNEFSAFFITRALRLERGRDRIVPAFVDKKRHQVAVSLLSREPRRSIFGEVPTLKVKPAMEFKGLYDKDGDTVFWLTDDQCRIPVEIESKILIGSLNAELVEYSNTRCPERTIPASSPSR